MSHPFRIFDTQGLEPRSVVDGYAVWSRNYDEMLTDNLDGPILSKFKPQLPATRMDVVDLGCGTGRTGSWIRDNLDAGSLVGVDVSEHMLSHAEQKNIYDALHPRDMTDTGLARESCDMVVNVLSACHVPDLAPLYREAYELLKSDGTFVMLDYHPHMLMCGHGTSFPDAEGAMVAIENHVHVLSDHTSTALKCGFEYVAFEESVITREWLDQGLHKEELLHHPIGFGFLWRKRA